MDFKTGIRKTLKGYQVEFTIGVQTFFLSEHEEETEEDSLEVAKWFERQLTHALNNLKN